MAAPIVPPRPPTVKHHFPPTDAVACVYLEPAPTTPLEALAAWLYALGVWLLAVQQAVSDALAKTEVGRLLAALPRTA